MSSESAPMGPPPDKCIATAHRLEALVEKLAEKRGSKPMPPPEPERDSDAPDSEPESSRRYARNPSRPSLPSLTG